MVTVQRVGPSVILPGTRLVLEGVNFHASVVHTMLLSGQMVTGTTSEQVIFERKLGVIDVLHAELVVDDELFQSMGEGVFQGTVRVRSRNMHGEVTSPDASVSLQLMRHLTPAVGAVGEGLVHLNSRVAVDGTGLLSGGEEGATRMLVDGCFLPQGTAGPCASTGRQVHAEVPVKLNDPGARERGWFAFVPAIVGLAPGELTATLQLVNVHGDGQQMTSASLDAAFTLDLTRIDSFGQQGASLGQYLEIRGAGFVGELPEARTIIRFDGSFTPDGATARAAAFDLVASYVEGGRVKYVMDDASGVGTQVDMRLERGLLSGSWTPTVYWKSDVQQGRTTFLTLRVKPVRQVVWVRFTDTWHESLRRFGLVAADDRIRDRILDVIRRDYAGVNLEVRKTEPTDFNLYARIDLAGQDPNGLGLLGYDNTPGKDVGNRRLYDWLGGVNALTQQDGYPGYGGVFLESLFGFSEHPPAGILKAPLHSPLFDEIFDPFRRDRGRVLSAAEAIVAPALTDFAGCPAQGRQQQAACAIAVLGNIIGSTAAHEIGHSLGLADPYGASDQFHNPGDAPNRLMDAGSDRPFAERAELHGQGPAVFCTEEYAYLKQILPLESPADPAVSRPTCF